MKTPAARLRVSLVNACILLLIFSAPTGSRAESGSSEARRLDDAREAFQTLLTIRETTIPRELLDGCRAVAVFPGVFKAALGVGGRRGHGVISVRDSSGRWSPPSFLTLTGGSYGIQIGVAKTQLVLFFMTEKSV